MKLTDSERTYINLIKEKTINTMNDVKPEEQIQIINLTIEKLLLLNKPDITETIEKYLKDQDKLNEEFKEKRKELTDLYEKYYNNTIKLYEEIKKL